LLFGHAVALGLVALCGAAAALLIGQLLHDVGWERQTHDILTTAYALQAAQHVTPTTAATGPSASERFAELRTLVGRRGGAGETWHALAEVVARSPDGAGDAFRSVAAGAALEGFVAAELDQLARRRQGFGGANPTTWTALGLLAVVGLLVGGVVTVRDVRGVARSLTDLHDAARRLAAGQHPRLTPAGPPEVAGLMRAFNHIGDVLQRTRGELETRVRERTQELATANRLMQAEVLDRVRAEKAAAQLTHELEGRVAERTAQLEAANKELEAFCYSVSHDLRAPLRSISGFSQALLEDSADRLDERGRHDLNRVCAAARRMAQLIDDLLKLSRLSRAEMHRDRVDLSALARTAAADLRHHEPNRDVEFVCPDGLAAHADSQLVRVLVENLLGNAWKFTGRTPDARVEFGRLGGAGPAAFFVRDNGAGFDMAYADKLFGAFQRLHAAGDFPGNGIGLATVQRVVSRHGGRAWAESVVGRGAIFYFTLEAG
jgi:signal transduction histidine kinase